MSLKTELVIFDWDGTLYNSVGQIVASLQHAAEEHKLTLTDEAAKYYRFRFAGSDADLISRST